MEIDVALSPAEIARLPGVDLEGVTCVVFDILRATSSMITGLAHGVSEIWPVVTIEDALLLKERYPDAVLGGERHGNRIEGFDIGNDPAEYVNLRGRRVITTTTNGTVALKACVHAEQVLVGALLNISALHEWIVRQAPERLLLVCAGTFETFALEDALAAGALAREFAGAAKTDGVHACEAVANGFETSRAGLAVARNGKALLGRGWGGQVDWCSQVSRFGTVGAMSSGVIRAV